VSAVATGRFGSPVKIFALRRHLNLTQLDVCGRSGIDLATYSRIEQGYSSRPSLTH